LTDDSLNRIHTKPVTPVDERVSPGKFENEGLVKIRLVRVIQLGNASFRDYTAVVRLMRMLVSDDCICLYMWLTPMMESSRFARAERIPTDARGFGVGRSMMDYLKWRSTQ